MDIQNDAPCGADVAWRRAGGRPGGRQAKLPKGFRLYCSAKWIRYFRQMDKSRLLDRLDKQQSLASLAANWIAEEELDRLIDGGDIGGSGCYLTMTSRLARLWSIVSVFQDMKAGRFVPTVYPRLLRRPHLPPSPAPSTEWHGPSAAWRERAVAIWAALPENDSDIFDRPAVTESPKNKHLAEKLAPLLIWARMSRPLSLAPTSWMQADNDNYAEPDSKPASNRERRIRPGSSYEELCSYVAKAGPLTVRKFGAKLGSGGSWELVPADPAYPNRAGKLHIANGETEAAGNHVEAGTILHQPDAFRELLGPEPDKDDVDMTWAWAARVYGRPRTMDGKPIECRELETSEQVINGQTFMVPRPFKPAGRIRRKVKMTQDEQLAVLATHPHPPVTYYPPGLPNGSADVRGIFSGAEIMSTKGKSGVERWEDVSDELSRQAEFERWAAALPPEQAKAMDLACTAANFREIGEAFGKEGKNAERYGKRLLIAANNNLKKILAA